jgi:DNA-binding PadR family transcriptional regulator
MDGELMARFQDPATLVLLSLAGGDKHGYAMMSDIESIVGESIGPGTLYGAIARLEERGHITPVEGDDERRQVYRISPDGLMALRERLDRLNSIVSVGRRRLEMPG